MNRINSPMDELRRRLAREIPRHLRDVMDVSVYRAFAIRHQRLLNIAELGKNNERAERYRAAGNRAYSRRQYDTALGQYNRSLCYARADSELVGLAYGNRSAVYYAQDEYEFALYNIDLAKAHNYPERLMPKLLAREVNCKREIGYGLSHGTVPHPLADINVEVNPKIPFLAKGIAMRQSDGNEDTLVAEREFNTGDVILNEKIELCAVLFKKSNSYCAHCSSSFKQNLIPCPGCVTVMYCGEECRKEDFRTVHRFECSIATKLWSVTYTNVLMTAKLFFYGLTAFNDNIDKMMEYCLPNAAVGSNPLDADLTNPNPLEMFKVLHQAKPESNSVSNQVTKLYAAIYSVIFLKNPLVQSIIRTEAQRDFFLRCLVTHGLVTMTMVATSKELGTLPVISNVFKHSCDPNVITIIHAGSFKMFVIRPIKTGDQIFTTYGHTWWRPGNEVQAQCRCVVCDSGPEGAKWRAAYREVRPKSPKVEEGLLGLERMSFDMTAGLVKFQRIVQLMASEGHHPGEMFGRMVRAYFERLDDFVEEQNEKRYRANLLRMRGDEVVPGLFED
ncbi:hypothetical protein quinque_006349 [Culex quinquefasciatus]|uniref:uncharacterized protein LOC6048206 n=1 Tax=Culex quinquefasciatus TaxID=7176 RepID=UPI0018E2B0CD|nr:uncharacterized protein LOC6048206 [Culex quinquefasciatus]